MANNIQHANEDGGLSALVSFFSSSTELEQWAIACGELLHPTVQRRLFELRTQESFTFERQDIGGLLQAPCNLTSGVTSGIQTGNDIVMLDFEPWTPTPLLLTGGSSPNTSNRSPSLTTPVPVIHGSPYRGPVADSIVIPDFTPCSTPSYNLSNTPLFDASSQLNTPSPICHGSPFSQRSHTSPDINASSPIVNVDFVPDLMLWTPPPQLGEQAVNTDTVLNTTLTTPNTSFYRQAELQNSRSTRHKSPSSVDRLFEGTDSEDGSAIDDQDHFDDDWFLSSSDDEENLHSKRRREFCSGHTPPSKLCKTNQIGGGDISDGGEASDGLGSGVKGKRTDTDPVPSTSRGDRGSNSNAFFRPRPYSDAESDSDDEKDNDDPPFHISQDSPKAYSIDERESRSFKNIIRETTFRARFNQEKQTEKIKDFLPEIRNMFEEMLERAVNDFNGQDLGRVYITHPDLRKPIVVPPRTLEHLTAEAIMEAIENVLQSEEDLSVSSEMEIQIGVASLQRGAARKPITNIERDIKNKHSIVKINNTKDNMCLARALIVGVAHTKWREQPEGLDKKQAKTVYDRLRRSVDKHQKRKAQQLHALANVPTNRPCSLLDIPNFEKALNVEVDVLSSAHNNATIYKASGAYPKRIYLYLVKERPRMT